MYKFWVLVKRDLGNLITNPTLLSFNTVFPFALILILGFLANGSYGAGGVNGYDYYGVSMLVFSVLNVSVTASNTFMERTLRASNLRVIHSPVRGSWVYLSKIVSTFLFTAGCYLVTMALCALVLGVDYGGPRAGYVVALAMLFDLASASLGVLFCCVFKSEEVANRILSLANNIMAILGGVFFSFDGFGRVAGLVSGISPVKWVLHAMLGIIYDSNLSAFLPTALILAALTALCIAGCKLTFRTEDYVS